MVIELHREALIDDLFGEVREDGEAVAHVGLEVSLDLARQPPGGGLRAGADGPFVQAMRVTEQVGGTAVAV